MKGIILTEGGEGIGWGHIFRCISLHDALIEKQVEHDFLVNYNGDLKSQKDNPFQVKNWMSQNIVGYDFVIIDSYLADEDYYKNLAKNNKLLVSIDDFMRIKYPNGYVLNGSILADKFSYNRKANTSLLGTKYIPLRKVFWNIGKRKLNQKVKKVFLTFGGEDSFNLSQKVLELIIIENVNITLVLGPNHKHKDEIIQKYNKQASILQNISAQQMRDLMLHADIAISAGGQTTYELAATGTPSILFQVADNQKLNMENWKKAGFISEVIDIEIQNWETLFLKQFNELYLSYNERKYRSSIGQTFVDGQGAKRVANEIMNKLRSNDN
ncbi:MAG: UDP-2,4-diacetamido-2,4,6-trideoxy-beta-L-altropyranose hydrolase [Candidatus Margulisbacteria bacterium GWF2_35_9]|nr:MAG: UDP-2,4-diacetamido-2,4,6-trideoxy-beta-L-altropyranose hydrolase [Candidatus Margulisbacteria bacterium GWF2_35_9]